MKTTAERLRIGSYVLATVVGLILGLMLAQCSAGDHGGSRVAWPASDSLGLHPNK